MLVLKDDEKSVEFEISLLHFMSSVVVTVVLSLFVTFRFILVKLSAELGTIAIILVLPPIYTESGAFVTD